jgi:hypothetical protein
MSTTTHDVFISEHITVRGRKRRKKRNGVKELQTKHINPNLLHQRLPAVCIAIHHGLDGPGIESRWGEFSAPVETGPGAHPAYYKMGIGSLSRE